MTNPRPESLLPWDPNFKSPQLDTNLLNSLTNAVTGAENAVTDVISGAQQDVQAAANALNQGVGQATQIGSEVVSATATAAANAAAEAAAAAAGAAQAAGGIVDAVVPTFQQAPVPPAATTSVPSVAPAPAGDLVSVIEQAAIGAARTASAAVLPGIEKALEARVAATVQAEATNILKKLEGGAEEPAVPNLDDFIHADGRAAAFRTLLIGIVFSGLWGLVNVLSDVAKVDWHNPGAATQVVSIAVTGVVGAVVAYVGRLAKPPAHIANAVVIPGTKS